VLASPKKPVYPSSLFLAQQQPIKGAGKHSLQARLAQFRPADTCVSRPRASCVPPLCLLPHPFPLAQRLGHSLGHGLQDQRGGAQPSRIHVHFRRTWADACILGGPVIMFAVCLSLIQHDGLCAWMRICLIRHYIYWWKWKDRILWYPNSELEISRVLEQELYILSIVYVNSRVHYKLLRCIASALSVDFLPAPPLLAVSG
jgi:hypothetical protein